MLKTEYLMLNNNGLGTLYMYMYNIFSVVKMSEKYFLININIYMCNKVSFYGQSDVRKYKLESEIWVFPLK